MLSHSLAFPSALQILEEGWSGVMAMMVMAVMVAVAVCEDVCDKRRDRRPYFRFA